MSTRQVWLEPCGLICMCAPFRPCRLPSVLEQMLRDRSQAWRGCGDGGDGYGDGQGEGNKTTGSKLPRYRPGPGVRAAHVDTWKSFSGSSVASRESS